MCNVGAGVTKQIFSNVDESLDLSKPLDVFLRGAVRGIAD